MGFEQENAQNSNFIPRPSGFQRKVNENLQELVEFRPNLNVRIWQNRETESYAPHWHSHLEIIMPVENHYGVKVKDETFDLQPGEVIFIPSGEIHETIAPEDGKRFVFLFDISFFAKMHGYSSIQSLFAEPIHLTPETHPKIYDDVYQILVQMRTEYFNENEYSELLIYSHLLQLFVKFGYNHIQTSDLFPNVRLYKQKEYIQSFNHLIAFIDVHYMEDLNLDTIAESTGFSKYHFSRLFKQYTNFTFCDYLTYRRLKAAEDLLAKPDLSITEVALQSGFPSISTFNRLFKTKKNCTPSEYRARATQIRRFN